MYQQSKEECYVPFKIDLSKFMNGNEPHQDENGLSTVIKDAFKAYETWDEYRFADGKQLSTYGCGPDLDQYVMLPACAGILRLSVPAGVINEPIQEIEIKPEWIQQVDIYALGDVSHGPLIFSQLTRGGAPDYTSLKQELYERFNDLSRICSKIAADTQSSRIHADLYDKNARESLAAVFNGDDFMHKRYSQSYDLPEVTRHLHWGLEYMQTYMKFMTGHLGIDSIIQHTHIMEEYFRKNFAINDTKANDFRAASAMTMVSLTQELQSKAANDHEKSVFSIMETHATNDLSEYMEQSTQQHTSTDNWIQDVDDDR